MLELLETALAAWRLASMLVSEDGPFAVFARLRHAAGIRSVVRRDHEGRPQGARVASNTLAEGLTCTWCVSMWAAVLFAIANRLRIPGVGLATRVLAASGGAILVHEAVQALVRDRRS